ncbi:MAG: hypothetical protein HY676_02515 [Chloroflexi bacterium]|nr:hypothetical protein [Chloroflexota bacterium]
MRKNQLKEKLRTGEGTIGMFCTMPSPDLVEVAGLLGFDFVIIDAEHGPPDVETVEHMVRAAESTGISTVTRVALNSPQNILRYLDAGSLGLQMPMVNTEEQARAVVNSVKYPPLGKRGLAGMRATGFGIERPLDEYVKMSNEQTLVVVQVETVEAVKNTDKIARIDNVDVVFVGPTDLSSSMGYTGQPTHPEVIKAIMNLGQIITGAGKIAGTIARNPAAYRQWREAGFQYLCTGDAPLFADSARTYLLGCRDQERGLK